MQTRILATIWLGLVLAACQGSDRQHQPMAAQPANLVCAGYVGHVGTTTFNDCVAYQETRNPGPSVPPYRMDQYNNRVDARSYRVDSLGRRMAIQNSYDRP
jgi:hypothetical protein